MREDHALKKRCFVIKKLAPPHSVCAIIKYVDPDIQKNGSSARVRSSHNLQVALQFCWHFLSFLHFFLLHFLHFLAGHLSSHGAGASQLQFNSYPTSDFTTKFLLPLSHLTFQLHSCMPSAGGAGYPGDLTVPESKEYNKIQDLIDIFGNYYV